MLATDDCYSSLHLFLSLDKQAVLFTQLCKYLAIPIKATCDLSLCNEQASC